MATVREGTIGEAFARVAETFGRLVVQHLALLRVELETEAKVLAGRARTGGRAVARALPFVIAGVVLFSYGVADGLGELVSPWLGRAARPLSLLLVGGIEAAVAVRWLGRRLAGIELPASLPAKPDGRASAGTEAAPLTAPAGDDELPSRDSAPGEAASGAGGKTATDREEMTYGAVGRA